MTEDALVETVAELGPQSLAEVVYWTLRREIIRGVLRPNQALTEAEIAVRLNVSRTPVRESMQRLSTDGLVVSQRRRWIVYEHSKLEIKHIYEVRAALESTAARLASERVTEEQAVRLLRIRDDRHADLGNDTSQRILGNEEFHNVIIEAADNPRLAELITRNRDYYFNHQVAALYSPEDLAMSARQHAKIIAAVCERDAETAERVAREHIDSALEIILTRLP